MQPPYLSMASPAMRPPFGPPQSGLPPPQPPPAGYRPSMPPVGGIPSPRPGEIQLPPAQKMSEMSLRDSYQNVLSPGYAMSNGFSSPNQPLTPQGQNDMQQMVPGMHPSASQNISSPSNFMSNSPYPSAFSPRMSNSPAMPPTSAQMPPPPFGAAPHTPSSLPPQGSQMNIPFASSTSENHFTTGASQSGPQNTHSNSLSSICQDIPSSSISSNIPQSMQFSTDKSISQDFLQSSNAQDSLGSCVPSIVNSAPNDLISLGQSTVQSAFPSIGEVVAPSPQWSSQQKDSSTSSAMSSQSSMPQIGGGNIGWSVSSPGEQNMNPVSQNIQSPRPGAPLMSPGMPATRGPDPSLGPGSGAPPTSLGASPMTRGVLPMMPSASPMTPGSSPMMPIASTMTPGASPMMPSASSMMSGSMMHGAPITAPARPSMGPVIPPMRPGASPLGSYGLPMGPGSSNARPIGGPPFGAGIPTMGSGRPSMAPGMPPMGSGTFQMRPGIPPLPPSGPTMSSAGPPPMTSKGTPAFASVGPPPMSSTGPPQPSLAGPPPSSSIGPSTGPSTFNRSMSGGMGPPGASSRHGGYPQMPMAQGPSIPNASTGYPPSSQGPQSPYPPHSQGPPSSFPPPGPPNSYPSQNQGPPSSYPPQQSQAPQYSQQGPQSPTIGGMQNRYPGPGGPGQMDQNFQQAQRGRLNPDDMPSPLQVMEEDQQSRTGDFITNMKGGLPPLATTEFIVRDGGNASPRFIRSTMYNVLATPELMKQCSVPFGLVVSPLAELKEGEGPAHLGTALSTGPIRCNRCKAYMSPLMQFVDGGRRFRCMLCKQVNDTPPDYFCHMDSQGERADKYQRPELCLGTFEYGATTEYCKDKLLPKEPAFIFVIEMSQMMVQRGIAQLLCHKMVDILAHLPRDAPGGQEQDESSVRVGFITYDSSVQVYKLTGISPEMMVLCNKTEGFIPIPDGILCKPSEVAKNIEVLMDAIPKSFNASREISGDLFGAVRAGMAALTASGRAGKLFVFHSSLPQVEGLGKLKMREDRKVLGTEKEKTILSPQVINYNNLAQDMVSVGCSVDLYVFNETYVDLATIGQLARLTGGQCYMNSFFQVDKDGPRFMEDLKLNVGKEIGFEAVMRVRTSTGVRPVDFFGHFFMSNTQDIELASINSSRAVALEVKHDDKITDEEGVFIQAALLYTSCGGQRRLRISNLSLNICTQIADLYKNCDLDALMNFLGKQAMFKFMDATSKQIKEGLIQRTAQILACYRKNCASPSSAGQLILPELMKLLPLYVNCLSKCDALSGGQDMTCDQRSFHIYQLSAFSVEASIPYYYPRLLPLMEEIVPDRLIPNSVRTSYCKLKSDEAFLLENGLCMFMWVGSAVPSTWLNEVFGVSAPNQLDPTLSELPENDNDTSKKVRRIIAAARRQRKSHMKVYIVPEQGKHEPVLRAHLVEDKGAYAAPSYVDFLCHVHKEIRGILS